MVGAGGGSGVVRDEFFENRFGGAARAAEPTGRGAEDDSRCCRMGRLGCDSAVARPCARIPYRGSKAACPFCCFHCGFDTSSIQTVLEQPVFRLCRFSPLGLCPVFVAGYAPQPYTMADLPG